MSKIDDDAAERERDRAQRAADPRAQDTRYRPRMVMLADEPRSLAEQGIELDEFIDPDEPGPHLRRRLRRNYRYGRGN